MRDFFSLRFFIITLEENTNFLFLFTDGGFRMGTNVNRSLESIHRSGSISYPILWYGMKYLSEFSVFPDGKCLRISKRDEKAQSGTFVPTECILA